MKCVRIAFTNVCHNLIVYNVILSEMALGQGRGGWDGVNELVLEAENNYLFICLL
jgi:hypothetical protein